jgi:hypothetical protein
MLYFSDLKWNSYKFLEIKSDFYWCISIYIWYKYNYPNLVSNSTVRIIRQDNPISYGYYPSHIRIWYLNEVSDIRKNAWISKIISESLSDPLWSVGKYPYHLYPFVLVIVCGTSSKWDLFSNVQNSQLYIASAISRYS